MLPPRRGMQAWCPGVSEPNRGEEICHRFNVDAPGRGDCRWTRDCDLDALQLDTRGVAGRVGGMDVSARRPDAIDIDRTSGGHLRHAGSEVRRPGDADAGPGCRRT